MKKSWILICAILLLGCATPNTYSQVETQELLAFEAEPTYEIHRQANEEMDVLLSAYYLTWQIIAGRANGVPDQFMLEHAEASFGNLKYATIYNMPLPPQSRLDELLLDTWLETFNRYLILRSEMSVLFTKQRGETNFSVILAYTQESGGTWGVAWKHDGETIRVLELLPANPLHASIVYPVAGELAGERVMLGLILNRLWLPHMDSPPVDVRSGVFSVTMENGDVITQDVSELPGFLVFLPDGDYTYWSLYCIDGKLLLDSLGESDW